MIRLLIKAFLTLLPLCGFAGGDPTDGHAHGEEKTVASGNQKPYFTVYSVSNKFELVLRYTPFKKGDNAHMTLFVSDFATNVPVNTGKISITALEDDKIKFTVTKKEAGIYEIESVFPANKSYTLAVNIADSAKADLMTLEGITPGKELPVTEVKETKTGNSWKTYLVIALSFIGGMFLTWFLLRKRNANRKALSVFLAVITLCIPVQPYSAVAHGDEDHGAKKTISAGGRMDQLEIPKETQFLFDIKTSVSGFSHFDNILKLYGKVMPTTEGEARIMAPQASTVITISVGVGERVGKGQILAVVEQTLGAAEQVQLEAEKSDNQGELEQAKKDYDRLKSLEGIVARKEITAAEIRYKTAVQNQRVYSTISAGSGRKFSIKAPIDGVVSNFNLSTGQVLEQGQQLFSIIDNSEVKIEAQLFGNDADKITKDVIFLVDVMDENRRPVRATLTAYSRVVDPVTQSTQVILKANNSGTLLMPGQYVNVSVVAKSVQRQLAVPTSSISNINGKPVVFVHTSPEMFAVRPVQTGEGTNESTVILNGLKEGERVVVNGAYQVKSIYLNQ